MKQKIVASDSWARALPYVFLLLMAEAVFVIVSLPLYLAVSPQKLQERGFIFPLQSKNREHLNTYIIRRKISLTTVFSAGAVLFFKFILISAVSFYLLGAQPLLAATQNWNFSTAGDYTVSSSTVEFTGGMAQLKDLGSTTTGSTTNSGFNTNSTGWTYADWVQPGSTNATGAYQASGGNPGGYVNVALTATKKNLTVGGYWRQAFTTTVSNPDTATLNLDWKSVVFTSPTAPQSFQLYAFIDTGSGVPILGTEVWSSGEITNTTSWAPVSTVNISSKVATAGTYYLKIAARATTNALTNESDAYTAGFDNVIVNWSKTTHSYDATKPTVTPTSSLSMPKTVSWNSFTETATKNGGEIYYQLSSDNGSTWKYWSGSTWATAGASNYNTAIDVNTNISTFATSTNQIKFKAFLSSNGTQQVSLDNVAIDYTENTPPTISSLAPAQDTGNGNVRVNYNLVDANSDPSSLATYEYSLTGAFAGEQVTMTASTTDPAHQGVSALSASPGGMAHIFVWDARAQLGNTYNSSVYTRLRANDGIANGAYTTSSAFAVDYVSSTVSNVAAVQTLGTSTVSITYDLFDNTTDNIFVELQISGDGGSTWTVPTTTATGNIGAGITSGSGKTITWNAGVDYSGQQKSNMQVRVRAKDKWQNQGAYTSSTNFSLDTLAPATLTAANLISQPNAGDTTVLIGGSFTEVNPNTNVFYTAINGGAYDGATTGTVDTATPSNQLTSVGATLDGNDYISGVKIIHTDDYGRPGTNENISPSTSLKYVKPYTPQAPTLSNPVTTRLDLQINPHASETTGLEYAIYVSSTNQYVQSDGTLGASAVWQTLGTGAGQWGEWVGGFRSSACHRFVFAGR